MQRPHHRHHHRRRPNRRRATSPFFLFFFFVSCGALCGMPCSCFFPLSCIAAFTIKNIFLRKPIAIAVKDVAIANTTDSIILSHREKKDAMFWRARGNGKRKEEKDGGVSCRVGHLSLFFFDRLLPAARPFRPHFFFSLARAHTETNSQPWSQSRNQKRTEQDRRNGKKVYSYCWH